MRTNVTTLLRDFPKVRKAAFAGEEVIIVTRDGNLRLSAVPASGESILGSLKGEITFADDDLDQPTTSESDWKPSLRRPASTPTRSSGASWMIPGSARRPEK